MCIRDSSSTAAMYEIILGYARHEQEVAEAAGTCVAPTPFMNDGGYQRWADYAASIGRGAEWRAWSEDETCNQRNVTRDRERDHASVPWCELDSGGGGGTCSDALEPNESSGAARAVGAGTQALQLCGGDVDWFTVTSTRTVTIEFVHASGDLDMAAYDAVGNQLGISQGTSNSEQLTVAAGAYTLRVQ